MTGDDLLGPCMMALTDKRRAFVRAMFENPTGSREEWAIAAGYSDRAEGGARVRAFEAYHNPKVQAAITEYGRTLFGTEGMVLALSGMLTIARNPNHPQHAKILELIANRVGFGEKQQIEVTHRDLTGDALIERIRYLESKYGNSALSQKLIEGEATEIKDAAP